MKKFTVVYSLANVNANAALEIHRLLAKAYPGLAPQITTEPSVLSGAEFSVNFRGEEVDADLLRAEVDRIAAEHNAY